MLAINSTAISCRGAGIQADLKTFTSLQSFGTSVLTSITSQNTLKVDGIHPIPAAFVSQQLEAVLSDIGTDAIKTGIACHPFFMFFDAHLDPSCFSPRAYF